jgi:aldehyde dehydrogenase (NAD+)
VKDAFIPELLKTIKTFYGANPKESPDLGRIINSGHTQRIAALLEGHGGKVLIGGEYDIEGRYVSPTVILNPDPNSAVLRDEIFGPILPIYVVPSLDAAISFVNEREKPLALYYFGSDSANKEKILTQTSSGGVCVNEALFHYSNPELPFGGVGNSGLSQYHGKWGFDSMTHPKAVLDKGAINVWPFSVRYPPFTEGNQALFAKMGAWMNYTQGTMHKRMAKVLVLILVLVGWKKGWLNWIGPFLDSVW